MTAACSAGVIGDPPATEVSSALALAGTATASSIQGKGYEAAKAVDGNLGTRWSSQFSDPQWLTVDLGAIHSINRVTINWQNSYAKDYQVRVSTDNATWTTIQSITNSDGGLDDLQSLTGSGRYVQIYGTRRATQYGYSIWEIKVAAPDATTGGAGATGTAGAAGTAGAKGTAGATGTAGAAGATGAAGAAGASGTCKRGEAYGANSSADLQALSSPAGGIRWWYNWAKAPDSGAASSYQSLGVEYVPMIWGSNFIANAASQIPKGSKYLLTFNEPNFGSQSNLTPAQAAALWPQIEQIANSFTPPLKIVSPSPNYCGGNCNETNPFTWFDEFFAACPSCRVDYIAVHWYACTLSALQSHINNAKRYGKPIWLTEFSCLDSAGDAAGEQTYMNQAVPYLEGEPAVFRYAWFTGRDGAAGREALLAAGSGQLTPLGQDYVSLAPMCR